MNPFGFNYDSSDQNHRLDNHSSQMKNSDLIRGIQNLCSALPEKEADALREFIERNSENIGTYDLSEENFRRLKHLSKFLSNIHIPQVNNI